MKKQLKIFTALYLMMLTHACDRMECEQNLVIENRSNGKVLVAKKSYGIDNGNAVCGLSDSVTLYAKNSMKYYIVRCIQGGWGLGPIEIYIVNPTKINDFTKPGYDCDSIGYYNDVLKVYKFETPEDFKKVNYKITYP